MLKSLCKKIIDRFFVQKKFYGTYQGAKIGTKSKGFCKKQEVTDIVIINHIKGIGQPIGAFPQNESNLSNLICLDLDCSKETKLSYYCSGEDSELEQEKGLLINAARETIKLLKANNINALLEDTVGGFHIWTFLETNIATKDAFLFGKTLKSIIANNYGINIEHFPKQASLKEGEFGNWIRLPGKYHSLIGKENPSQPFTRVLTNDIEWISTKEIGAWESILNFDSNEKQSILDFIKNYHVEESIVEQGKSIDTVKQENISNKITNAATNNVNSKETDIDFTDTVNTDLENLDQISAWNNICGLNLPNDGRNKYIIRCVNPSHLDKNPSAWLERKPSTNILFWHCSKCYNSGLHILGFCMQILGMSFKDAYDKIFGKTPPYSKSVAGFDTKEDFNLDTAIASISEDAAKEEVFKALKGVLKKALKANISKEDIELAKEKIKAKFDFKGKETKLLTAMLKDIEKEIKSEKKQKDLDGLRKSNYEKYLLENIRSIRSNDCFKIFEKKKNASDFIIEDMKKFGKFHRTENNRFFYFFDKEKKAYDVDKMDFAFFINNRYGLNKSENEFDFFIEEVKTWISYNINTFTKIHTFAFFDEKNLTIYIDSYDNKIIKVTPQVAQVVDNGTDGVLFENNLEHKPFSFIEQENSNLLDEVLFDSINFDDSALAIEQQKFLLKCWGIYAPFFKEIQPTKPILLILGEKGSGKTVILRKIIKLFFGENSDIMPIPSTEEAFLTTICANYLSFFDNADTYKDWLNDCLAVTSTGQKIEKRKLYTTNEVERYHPNCWLALTAREPKFKRDDVVDRLLLIKLARLSSFASEFEMFKAIKENRNALWTEIILDLQAILQEMQQNGSNTTSQKAHRMADFINLGATIANCMDKNNEWEGIIKNISKDRSEFLLFENPIFQILEEILEEISSDNRRSVVENPLYKSSVKQLFNLFKRHAEENHYDLSWLKSPNSLAQKMSQILPDLRKYFNIEVFKQKRGGCIYTIKKNDVE